jgi:hypothetical protein
MTSFREEFGIESFEAGRDLWHARIRRTNPKPLTISGVAFPDLEVGFVWPDGTAAIGDAQTHIDRFGARASHGDTPGLHLPTIA